MSTSEPFDPSAELPLSESALSALVSQLYAKASGIGAGPFSPPASAGAAAPASVPASAPDATAPASAARTVASVAGPYASPVTHLAPPVGAGPFGVADRPGWTGPGGFESYAPAPKVPAIPGISHPSSGVSPVSTPGQAPDAAPWPGRAEASALASSIASAVTVSFPAPPVADRLGFGIPTLTTLARPAEPDYFELGSPARSGGIRHDILNDRSVFDVDAVRRDFPILEERVNGHRLVWLDNAATTHKPVQVIDRISHFYRHENSNIHRAAHELAARASTAYEDARETVRRFLNAGKVEEIVFVRGTTEAINLVAFAWGGKHIGAGDEIVITNLEHHANTVPWQQLAQRTGAVLKVAPVDDDGTLILSEFERLLGPRTKLVAATHVSNALGTVNPVKQIVELGHRYGARVLIDGAQSVPHTPIDVQEIGADFFVFSGHKIFGPTGIGVLYGREDALAETPHWQSGGNMIADVTYERTVFQGPPNRYEAGTGNIADAVGLGAALKYVEEIGIERIAAYEHALVEYAQPRLAAIPGVRIIGTSPHKASVVSFVLAGQDTLSIGRRLNEVGIAVRAGHHCAQPILRRFGLETTVRPSFAFYNTKDEADRLVEAVARIAANPNAS